MDSRMDTMGSKTEIMNHEEGISSVVQNALDNLNIRWQKEDLICILTDIGYPATEKNIKAFAEKINRSFQESLTENVNGRLKLLALMTDFQDAEEEESHNGKRNGT